MFETLFGGANNTGWIIAGIMAIGLVGVKLVQMNFERKNKDKR